MAALLLLALSTRMLIPAGYMPDATGLVLCHGYPGVSARIQALASASVILGTDSADFGRAGHDGSSGNGMLTGLCSFAAAASGAAAAPAATLLVRVDRLDAVEFSLPVLPSAHRRVVPTRLPRGPPSLV